MWSFGFKRWIITICDDGWNKSSFNYFFFFENVIQWDVTKIHKSYVSSPFYKWSLLACKMSKSTCFAFDMHFVIDIAVYHIPHRSVYISFLSVFAVIQKHGVSVVIQMTHRCTSLISDSDSYIFLHLFIDIYSGFYFVKSLFPLFGCFSCHFDFFSFCNPKCIALQSLNCINI